MESAVLKSPENRSLGNLDKIKRFCKKHWISRKSINEEIKAISNVNKTPDCYTTASILASQKPRLKELFDHIRQYKSCSGGEIDHFSDLCDQPWFWGPLSRLDANDLLKNHPVGTFIVRDSEHDCSKFTLTFRCSNGSVLNHRITQTNGSYAFLEGEAFPTIRDLIENAINYSKRGAYCLSRPTSSGCDATVDNIDETLNQEHSKVRLLYPLGRLRQLTSSTTIDVPSLHFLCRFALLRSIRVGLIDPKNLTSPDH